MLILRLAKRNLHKQLILRVPISHQEGEDYYLQVSRNDKTHVQCHCRGWWLNLFHKCDYSLAKEFKNVGVIWSSLGVFAGVFQPS